MSCFACDRIELIRKNENPHFIAELRESFWVLADGQGYRGWSILLLKNHHEHLGVLPRERSGALWSDVARVADVMTRVLKPRRINYECLGNQLNHIHWHIIPRYESDPEPLLPIWHRPAGELNSTLHPDDQANLLRQFLQALDG